MHVRRVVSTTVALLLLASAVVLAPEAHAGDARDPEEAASMLLWMLNEERSARGIPLARPRDDVIPMAVDHSGDMAREGRLWHNEDYFTEANRTRLHAGALGENVGYGPTVHAIHDALMASESHRHVLLSGRYTVVGIGVVRSGDRWWITQDYVEPR